MRSEVAISASVTLSHSVSSSLLLADTMMKSNVSFHLGPRVRTYSQQQGQVKQWTANKPDAWAPLFAPYGGVALGVLCQQQHDCTTSYLGSICCWLAFSIAAVGCCVQASLYNCRYNLCIMFCTHIYIQT
jgi:hypothetical protein